MGMSWHCCKTAAPLPDQANCDDSRKTMLVTGWLRIHHETDAPFAEPDLASWSVAVRYYGIDLKDMSGL